MGLNSHSVLATAAKERWQEQEVICNNMAYQEIIKEEEIDANTIFILPSNFSYVNYNGKILAIAVDVANWIILNSESELLFFKQLKKKKSIKDAILLSNASETDVSNVITQIIAKGLLNKEVNSKHPGSFLQIYLTNACNLRCPHCYMSSGVKNDNELSYAEICKLIQSFAYNGGEKIIFTGGEIALRHDLIDILREAKQANLEVEILTNGIAWTTQMFNNAQSLIDQVQISIDGFNEEENAMVRGVGNFDKSLQAVDEFIKRNIPTRVAITPRYHTQLHKYIDNYCEFARKLLQKYEGKLFGISFSGELMDGRDVSLSTSQQDYYKKCIEDIEAQLYCANKNQSFIESIKHHVIADNCAFGQLSIASDGDIFLCPKVTTLKPIGNVREINLDKLFEFSKIAANKSHINSLKPCCECDLKYICGGGCRIKHFTYLKNGQIPPDNIISKRSCNFEQKRRFYDLMIETNEYIYQ